jgi:hypothetical protein
MVPTQDEVLIRASNNIPTSSFSFHMPQQAQKDQVTNSSEVSLEKSPQHASIYIAAERWEWGELMYH